MSLSLNDYLKDARQGKYAIGHFNFATADVLRAIVEGAKEAGAPCVMVGTSEGEAEFLGMTEAVALAATLGKEYNFPIFLNADHFKSFEKCKAAIDAGYDSIIADFSKLPTEENIAQTKKVVDYARAANPAISVEGELGYLRGSSQLQEKIEISPDDYTKPGQASRLVTETGVDRLAIVFGNIHGIVTKQKEHLDIEYLKKIATVVPSVHLVLHGASGLKDDEISAAIKAGIVNVHFNTELRVVYAKKLDEELHKKEPFDKLRASPFDSAQDHDIHDVVTTPYKYLKPAASAVKQLVFEKTKLFMGL